MKCKASRRRIPRGAPETGVGPGAGLVQVPVEAVDHPITILQDILQGSISHEGTLRIQDVVADDLTKVAP